MHGVHQYADDPAGACGATMGATPDEGGFAGIDAAHLWPHQSLWAFPARYARSFAYRIRIQNSGLRGYFAPGGSNVGFTPSSRFSTTPLSNGT